MKLTTTILGVVILLCLAELGVAAGKEKNKRKRHSESTVAVQARVSIFSGSDREVIHQYVHDLPADRLPPGLAKRGGALPPGLEKQFRRNGTLPPGLQKKLTPFPPDLEHRLPPLATDLDRVFVEGRAVIYNRNTRVVLDVIAEL